MTKTREIVLLYALQNAVFYRGEANLGAVLGKVLAGHPELRQKIAVVRKEVEDTVNEVNAMEPDEQKAMLKKLSPKMLEKKEKKQEELPDIPGASSGKFVTRFAPSPTGPLNIGQLLRAVLLPYIYVKKYEGRFILRIEDTDPVKIRKEYYAMIMEDLMSVGVKWDRLSKESDSMEAFYKHGEELLKAGRAYVCTCPAEDFKKLKVEKKDCPCRARKGAENLTDWKKMLSGGYKEGEAVVRLKASMSDPNPTMRDPPLLRIVDAEHPITGGRYRVWPLYNFANTVEDHYQGITHVFRGKEHEHNTTIQGRIYSALKWKPPHVVNFGMVYLPGTKIHTRDMRQWIDEGTATGWDDPKLPTVRALLRRGFQPKALKKFALVCGLSKTDIRVGWENLEGINRKLVDSLSNRYMAVFDPVSISVKKAPKLTEAKDDLHPDFPARGRRKLPVDWSHIHISGDDWKSLKGKIIRLKGLGNIKLDKASEYRDNEIVQKMPKIQWVSEPHVAVELLTPQGILQGFGEVNMKKLKAGALIQLERVGFGRVDSVGRNKVVVAFAHK